MTAQIYDYCAYRAALKGNTDGKGRFLCGKSGGESKFYDKSEAQRWADKHNEGRDD